MRCQAAIFDLDGTLVDTLDDLADSMNAVLHEMGFPGHPVDSYRYFVGLGMMNLVKQAGPPAMSPEMTEKLAALMGQRYAANWATKSRPYAGMPELLATLRSRGIRLAILSNKPDAFTQQFASRFFPAGTFDIVMGAQEGIPHKPDPAGALLIAGKMGIPPGDFLYFGDTNTDMRTGRAAGMYTVGVSWGFRPVKELVEAGAHTVIDRPEQALDLVESP